MLTISEASPTDLHVSAAGSVQDQPRRLRLRTSSESLPRLSLPATTDDLLLLQRNVVQRSASCSEVYVHQRRERTRAQLEQDGSDAMRYRVKMRCRDEALCVRSHENILKLVETVQNNNSGSSTNTLIAQKALKYRRLLDRAEKVDLSDPTFDIREFLSAKRGRTELVSGSGNGGRVGLPVP